MGISLIVIVLWFIKKIIGSSSVQRVSLIPSSPSSLKRCEPLCLFYNTEEEEEQHPSITANMSSVLSSPMRCNPEFIFQTLPAPSLPPPSPPTSQHILLFSNYQTEIWILLTEYCTAVQGCIAFLCTQISNISLQCLQYYFDVSDCLQIVVFRLKRRNNRNLCRETFKECEAG